MPRERKNLKTDEVVYNQRMSGDFDDRMKIKLIKERRKRGGKLDQKEFLAEILEKGLEQY